MSSPLATLKSHKKNHSPRKKSDDIKLPTLTDRCRNLYGREYHSAAEAYNFMSPEENSTMPNLLCDYTSVDIANRDPTPDTLDSFLAHFDADGLTSLTSVRTSRVAGTYGDTTSRNKINGQVPYAPTPPDVALMTSMAQRLRTVEGQLKDYSREIIEKDTKIKQLEHRLATAEYQLNRSSEGNESQTILSLQRQCDVLKKQVIDMESFLEDYGMIWVGDPQDDDFDEDTNQGHSSAPALVKGTENATWQPTESVNLSQFPIPFNELVKAVRDLNVLVGEGVARIAQTKSGAVFKIPDPVNLEFYADGFVLFEGPFRLYSDMNSREFLQDILDGYFPSELKERFPDGVPFALKDHRDLSYLEREKPRELFPGSGHKLLQELETRVKSSGRESHKKLNANQFAKKLPLSVVKNGKVIDIRNDIETHLDPHKAKKKSTSVGDSSDCTILATDFMKEVYKVDPEGKDMRGLDPGLVNSVTTLRIRSEHGDRFYIAKMYRDETIGDLRKYLASSLPEKDLNDLDIITTFPKKITHSDNSVTLLEAGLTPNGVLSLKISSKANEVK